MSGVRSGSGLPMKFPCLVSPTPLNFHQPSQQAAKIISQLASDVKFLHWEAEFPDVFTPQRSGFDAMIGNPPWDVMKPNSQEFFTDFDPLYRTYDKQAALRRQTEMFQSAPVVADQWDDYNARFKALANWARSVGEPFDMVLARGKEADALAKLWVKHRTQFASYSDAKHPFRLQGSADLNSYKMFSEFFWNLLKPDGRLGVVLPSGIYSDFGTKDLREELLLRGRLDLLYAFQNEKRVFASAHHACKQTVIVATKNGSTQAFSARFRMGVGDSPQAHEISDDILRNVDAAMVFTTEDVRAYSPKTLSLMELRCKRDLVILRTILAHSIRVGETGSSWDISFGREFHMTDDSRLFPPREIWEAKGYSPDIFGRWVATQGEIALPVYQGAMFHHFFPAFQSFGTSSARKSDWVGNSTNDMRFVPRFLVSENDFRKRFSTPDRLKLALRDITSSTNERTLVSCLIPNFPSGHTTPVFRLAKPRLNSLLTLSALLSCLSIDYVARASMTGSHMSYFVFSELPIPVRVENWKVLDRLAIGTASLSMIHRYFAPEWLKMKRQYPELIGKEWKRHWAVTEGDRLRLRVEIDALCADLYGLEPDDFDWIVRDDRTDPKGFYRVDRELPFCERLTGLAAAAFRASREGKWSAESAAGLSNDEFFEILGIPELTNAEAAKAKGLPCPLIQKRGGCHVWNPESFPPDDPRHGWTWDDCWKDAVALLGSEDAVRQEVEEGEASPRPQDQEQDNEPFKLRKGKNPNQGRLF